MAAHCTPRTERRHCAFTFHSFAPRSASHATHCALHRTLPHCWPLHRCTAAPHWALFAATANATARPSPSHSTHGWPCRRRSISGGCSTRPQPPRTSRRRRPACSTRCGGASCGLSWGRRWPWPTPPARMWRSWPRPAGAAPEHRPAGGVASKSASAAQRECSSIAKGQGQPVSQGSWGL